MDVDFKDYYDILKENLGKYTGEYDKFIDYGPDLFKLLTEILSNEIVKKEERLKINAAIAYFVVPYDIIPEQIYGPYGYVDDIYLCTHVIKEITDVFGYEILNNIWEKDENLQDIVELCYKKSKKIVGNDTNAILIYAGLTDHI